MPERERLLSLLRVVAPGTVLREGLENVLRARTGGLLVVGESPAISQMIDGGMRLDIDLTPHNLYELCKMDGALVLSADLRRILWANVGLMPDSKIPSLETGIRHRTAERTAKQTGQLVIAISQRRHLITAYMGEIRHVLRGVESILSKANEALSILERYQGALASALHNLGALEFEQLATLQDVATAVARAVVAGRIATELNRYIVELGSEGRLISMQLQELEAGDVLWWLVRDYAANAEEAHVRSLVRQLEACSGEELLDAQAMAKLLGLPSGTSGESPVTPRGYRLLRRIGRLPQPVLEKLVARFGTLPNLVAASLEALDEVEGIGEARAHAIRDGLRRSARQHQGLRNL